MDLIKFLFNFSLFLSTVQSFPVFELVKDFITLHQEPLRLSAFVCWKKQDILSFIKFMNENSIMVVYSTAITLLDDPEHQLYFIDLDCEKSEDILFQANTLNMFKSPYKWLVLNNSKNLSTNLNILTDSSFYTATKLRNGSFQIKTVYKLHESIKDFHEETNGLWISTQGFKYFSPVKIKYRRNFNHFMLNISYVITNNDSLKHLNDYRDKHIDGISKMNYFLMQHVVGMVNASKNEIYRSTWGYKNQSTGVFSGMIGDLQSKEANIGGTPTFFTKDRIPYIDYIGDTTPTKAKFLFRAPPLSYVSNIFTKPFDSLVWLTFLILTPLISIILFVIFQFESKIYHNIFDKTIIRPNISDIILITIGAISQQGSELTPRSKSGRIISFFLFFSFMFFYVSYSGQIVALLQSRANSINTVEDLLNSRIELGVEDLPYSRYYFETETELLRKNLYEKKIAPKGGTKKFLKLKDGIKKVRQEFFAFHTECTSGYKVVSDTFLEHEKCGLREIGVWRVTDPWIAIEKNSTYKEIFKSAFRRLKETGIQNREFKRVYTKKPTCQHSGSSFVSVGLIDCYHAFLIFISGLFISIILLGIERLYQRYVEKVIIIMEEKEYGWFN